MSKTRARKASPCHAVITHRYGCVMRQNVRRTVAVPGTKMTAVLNTESTSVGQPWCSRSGTGRQYATISSQSRRKRIANKSCSMTRRHHETRALISCSESAIWSAPRHIRCSQGLSITGSARRSLGSKSLWTAIIKNVHSLFRLQADDVRVRGWDRACRHRAPIESDDTVPGPSPGPRRGADLATKVSPAMATVRAQKSPPSGLAPHTGPTCMAKNRSCHRQIGIRISSRGRDGLELIRRRPGSIRIRCLQTRRSRAASSGAQSVILRTACSEKCPGRPTRHGCDIPDCPCRDLSPAR